MYTTQSNIQNANPCGEGLPFIEKYVESGKDTNKVDFKVIQELVGLTYALWSVRTIEQTEELKLLLLKFCFNALNLVNVSEYTNFQCLFAQYLEGTVTRQELRNESKLCGLGYAFSFMRNPADLLIPVVTTVCGKYTEINKPDGGDLSVIQKEIEDKIIVLFNALCDDYDNTHEVS